LRFVFPPGRAVDVDFDRDIFRERADDVFDVLDEARALRFIAASLAPLAVLFRAPPLALFRVPLVFFRVPLVLFRVPLALFRAPIGSAIGMEVRFAAVVALAAVRRAVCAAARAVSVVDCAAFSAVLPMSRGEVMPVISAARSVSWAMPSTLAAMPRPTTVAPDSIKSLTARADCSMTESRFPLLDPAPFARCVAITPPGIRHECDRARCKR